MIEEVGVGAIATGALAVVGNKIFGPVLSMIGDDLSKAYARGRDRILANAAKKVANPDDGKIPNLRVTRDVMWNGFITDDEVCAEYFGGLLAGARSVDGKDDAVIHYVDIIKAMSSKQLELHFAIYTTFHEILMKKKEKINPAAGADVHKKQVWLSIGETKERGLRPVLDLPVLHRQGLVHAYKFDNHAMAEGHYFQYLMVYPSVFGIMLYAAALAQLDDFLLFDSNKFDYAGPISKLKYYGESLEDLLRGK